MPWTYIVECRDGTFYVGSTYDLERRISEHNLGFGAKYTRPRSRRPVRLAWCSEFNRMDEAYWYEKQIQGWSRDKRVALIEGRLDLLVELAKSRQRFDDVMGRLSEESGRGGPGRHRIGDRHLREAVVSVGCQRCGGLDKLDQRGDGSSQLLSSSPGRSTLGHLSPVGLPVGPA